VRASERALRLFGVGIVLQKNTWSDAELAAGAAGSETAPFASAPILPDAPFVQRFVDVSGRPGPLGFEFLTNGWRNECTFRVTVEDTESGARIADAELAAGSMRPRGQTRFPCTVDIPAEDHRVGRKLVLRIASDDAVEGRTWSVLCRTVPQRGPAARAGDDWSARQGSAPVAGMLALQPDEGSDSLTFEEQIGPFAARRCTESARFHTVSRAFPAQSASEAWDTVQRPGFDPREIVVVEDADATTASPRAEPAESGRVDVLDERAGRLHLRVQRSTPGWLVADIAWYPGWRARINGVPARLHCANYAFTALALPAGESTVELELAPDSVRTGTVLSGVGLLALSCMMGAAFAAARART
jgi:hypothetical protein